MGAKVNDRRLLVDTARAIERAIDAPATIPVQLAEYTVATVPPAGTYPRGLVYVSDETGGSTIAFSDGTDWLRVQDLAVIS